MIGSQATWRILVQTLLNKETFFMDDQRELAPLIPGEIKGDLGTFPNELFRGNPVFQAFQEFSGFHRVFDCSLGTIRLTNEASHSLWKTENTPLWFRTTFASMRIVFLGTPEFAVASLQALIQEGHEIVAVVTATDKPGGRGRTALVAPPVATFARSQGLNLLQPPKLKEPEFLATLEALQADLFIVVAFRMLPKQVWSMPPQGTLNLHGSLLPAYRGAAPIQWAVLNGDRETGVSIFRLKHEIDTGDILLQERLPIGVRETFGHLYERMMAVGARALCLAVRALAEERAAFVSQTEQEATPAPKIFQDTARLDFRWDADRVLCWVRGMHPVPVAWFTLNGRKIKVHEARPAAEEIGVEAPGTLLHRTHRPLIACADTWIELISVQPEGKARMAGRDWLNGLAISEGTFIPTDSYPTSGQTP